MRPLRTFLPRKIRRERLPEPQAFVVSYPKCGRTWLRLMLGHYLCLRYGFHPKLALETLYLTHTAGLTPLDFTHDGTEARGGDWQPVITDKTAFAGKRVMLLMRDPRDVVVSGFFQATKRDLSYKGSLSDFIRQPSHGIVIYEAFLSAWEQNKHIPAVFDIMRYREIHADPAGQLKKLLGFIGCTKIDDRKIIKAVAYGSFPNMRHLEHKRFFASKRLAPKDDADNESYKVRRGKIGGYVDYMNADDCAFIEQTIDRSPCGFVNFYRNSIGAGAIASLCEAALLDYGLLASYFSAHIA